MGGERASTIRQREAGKICCLCNTMLGPPPPGHKPGFKTGGRYCERCGPPQFIACYMRFELSFGTWVVDVSRDGRPVRTIRFADDFKITEMARRGRGQRTSEDRNMLELAIRNKRGALTLYLTPEEFAKLKG